MQLMQFCFYSGEPFEETHENSLWRWTDAGRTAGLTEVFHEALADLKKYQGKPGSFFLYPKYTPQMKCPERAWKYVQENEELQELSDKYFDTPALAEPDLVSIPNP